MKGNIEKVIIDGYFDEDTNLPIMHNDGIYFILDNGEVIKRKYDETFEGVKEVLRILGVDDSEIKSPHDLSLKRLNSYGIYTSTDNWISSTDVRKLEYKSKFINRFLIPTFKNKNIDKIYLYDGWGYPMGYNEDKKWMYVVYKNGTIKKKKYKPTLNGFKRLLKKMGADISKINDSDDLSKSLFHQNNIYSADEAEVSWDYREKLKYESQFGHNFKTLKNCPMFQGKLVSKVIINDHFSEYNLERFVPNCMEPPLREIFLIYKTGKVVRKVFSPNFYTMKRLLKLLGADVSNINHPEDITEELLKDYGVYFGGEYGNYECDMDALYMASQIKFKTLKFDLGLGEIANKIKSGFTVESPDTNNLKIKYNDEEEKNNSFTESLHKTPNLIVKKEMKNIYDLLNYYNEEFASAFVKKEDDARFILTFDEMVTLKLALNNYPEDDVETILNCSELTSEDLIETFEKGALQLICGYVMEDNEHRVNLSNLLNDTNDKEFIKAYENKLFKIKEAEGKEKERYAQEFVDMIRHDYPIMQEEKNELLDYRTLKNEKHQAAVIVMSAFKILTMDVNIKNPLTKEELDYLENLEVADCTIDKFNKYESYSINNTSDNKIPKYQEFKEAYNDYFANKYNISLADIKDKDRDLIENSVFQEEAGIKEDGKTSEKEIENDSPSERVERFDFESYLNEPVEEKEVAVKTK